MGEMAHEPICRENYKRWLVNGVHGYLQIGFSSFVLII